MSQSITVTVRYFASIREALGTGSETPFHAGRHRGRPA